MVFVGRFVVLLLVVCNVLFTVCCLPVACCCVLFGNCCLLRFAFFGMCNLLSRLLFVANCLLAVARCVLLAVPCLLRVNSRLSSVVCVCMLVAVR